MDEETKKQRAPKTRLSAERRERFLQVLGETGNRSIAAEAIGADPRGMDQRREFDPLLDRQWKEAIAQAQRRLAGASGPLDCIGGAEPMVVQRGPGGKLRVIRAGSKRWSRPVEERFFAHIAMTGNLAASARAVGFTSSCIFRRRRKYPEFEQRLQDALEDAELALEFRLAIDGGGFAGPEEGATAEASPTPLPSPASGRGDRFDADTAMRFLKWRSEKRNGRGRRGRPVKRIEFDESMALLEKKLRPLRRRDEAEKLAQGWSRDEAHGWMVPPGWVRAANPEGD